ncbi:MAG TPA: hypothetical protein VKU87_02145, partial [Thermomicrobiaceae bacterium]|nr:hypothetical protein [Thermomicrobiaceae bacterium]
YVYIPASQDQGLGDGDFGSAIISGQLPFYAAVDEVKYSTGEAMSYMATAAVAQRCRNADQTSYDCVSLSGNTLSLPLFQNGQNVNGVEHGDTSGINLFNPGNNTATGSVLFYGLDGTLQTPSNIGTVPFSVASHATGLIYAPSMAQMSPGIQLTAVVTVDTGRVAAVSNNVNYDVNGDGGVVFQMFNHNGNYRFICSQTNDNCAIGVQTPGGLIFLPPTSQPNP